MRSIAVKLTLAFLLIGLTGAALVAVILRQSTRTAFDQFIQNQELLILADNLEVYYQSQGSWESVEEHLPALMSVPQHPLAGGQDSRRGRTPFTLIGPDQKVVFGGPPDQVSKQVSGRDLEKAIALTVDGKIVGWLSPVPVAREWISNTPEARFLENVNRATLTSALIAAILALSAGGLLAYSMTRSLRELTEATEEIARGKLGKQVKVRSKDEIGELAASFNKMSLDLAQAIQARRQMTADIAHDLRTPLSVISGYAEALSDEKLPGTPETYTILYQETLHLSHLVDDLRTLSLAEAGELQLNLMPSEPQALLERVAARHAIAAQQKGVSLEVEATQESPRVIMDPDRMAQVFDNLIGNAFRYTPAGGEIVLDAAAVGGKVLLRVRDNGSGIAAEDLPYVFDRFYRGDKSRQANEESGLGLAIAKSIVEAHGGTIAVESAPGKRTTFTITLDVGK